MSREIPLIFLTDISHVSSSKSDDEADIKVHLRNGETIDARKPIRVQIEDGKVSYLKIPNPDHHAPQIAYVETAVARLAKHLLTPKNAIVPNYQVTYVRCAAADFIPCCLVEEM